MFSIKVSKSEGRVFGEVSDEKGNEVDFVVYGEGDALVLCVSGDNVISKNVYNILSNFMKEVGNVISASITFPSVEDAGSKRLKGNVWICSRWVLKENRSVEDALNSLYSLCHTKIR